MINTLITSQTRIKLLKKFFLNNNIKAHLRGLETELNESSNSIRIELNRFEEGGLLTSLRDGNKKVYQANADHPLYDDIHNIILKETGIDKLIRKIIPRLGNLKSIHLVGAFAHGTDGPVIELVLVSGEIDLDYLNRKMKQAEDIIGRKVSYTILEPEKAKMYMRRMLPSEILLLWRKEGGMVQVERFLTGTE